jgi:hypothetical protein
MGTNLQSFTVAVLDSQSYYKQKSTHCHLSRSAFCSAHVGLSARSRNMGYVYYHALTVQQKGKRSPALGTDSRLMTRTLLAGCNDLEVPLFLVTNA